MVIAKDDKVKRCFWKLTVVKQLFEGNDGCVRAAVIKVGESNSNRKGGEVSNIEVKTNDTESKSHDML